MFLPIQVPQYFLSKYVIIGGRLFRESEIYWVSQKFYLFNTSYLFLFEKTLPFKMSSLFLDLRNVENFLFNIRDIIGYR